MAELPRLRQSPTDPEFVQDPYRFYTEARAAGPIVFWEDYDMPMATTAETVGALLRDRRLGREMPNPPEVPDRLAPFYAIDAHSMLELEPPRHTRRRSLVLRAFTSRRIAALAPEIETLTHELIDALPEEPFDLLPHFAGHAPGGQSGCQAPRLEDPDLAGDRVQEGGREAGRLAGAGLGAEHEAVVAQGQ